MRDKQKVKAGRKGGYNGVGDAKRRTPEQCRLAGIASGAVRRANAEVRRANKLSSARADRRLVSATRRANKEAGKV